MHWHRGLCLRLLVPNSEHSWLHSKTIFFLDLVVLLIIIWQKSKNHIAVSGCNYTSFVFFWGGGFLESSNCCSMLPGILTLFLGTYILCHSSGVKPYVSSSVSLLFFSICLNPSHVYCTIGELPKGLWLWWNFSGDLGFVKFSCSSGIRSMPFFHFCLIPIFPNTCNFLFLRVSYTILISSFISPVLTFPIFHYQYETFLMPNSNPIYTDYIFLSFV